MVHVIIGIGQHRHLKFIAKHNNSIVFDNRLFLFQFQKGPKSILSMYIVLQPSKTIGVYNLHCRCMPLLLKRFIYIAFGEKRIHIPQVNSILWLKNNIFLKPTMAAAQNLLHIFWGIPICQWQGYAPGLDNISVLMPWNIHIANPLRNIFSKNILAIPILSSHYLWNYLNDKQTNKHIWRLDPPDILILPESLKILKNISLWQMIQVNCYARHWCLWRDEYIPFLSR